jgi:WD40 repeat protein
VTALANQDDRLFSGDLNSVKIWDIGSMRQISELKTEETVKQIKISQSKKLLIIATEKQIVLWDLICLTKVDSFPSQNQLQCIEIVDQLDMLFAGT